MLELDAARLIRNDGWNIIRGPYFNTNLFSKKGVYVWSIKTVMTKAELERRGIKIHPKSGSKAGDTRTVRFVGIVEGGSLTKVAHLTSSGRKRLGKGRPRSRKGGRYRSQAGNEKRSGE